MSQEEKRSKAALLFSNNLRKQLKRTETTQRTFAADLGVGEVAVSSWINGSRFPTEKFIVATAEYFNVPVSALFMTDDEYEFFKKASLTNITSEDQKKDYDFSIIVNNDEMSPDFLRGDTVYCASASKANSGDIVIVNMQGRNVIRRVYFTANSIVYVCTNPKYPPQQYILVNSNIPKIVGIPVSYSRSCK